MRVLPSCPVAVPMRGVANGGCMKSKKKSGGDESLGLIIVHHDAAKQQEPSCAQTLYTLAVPKNNFL
jgi:hypothetical protein